MSQGMSGSSSASRTTRSTSRSRDVSPSLVGGSSSSSFVITQKEPVPSITVGMSINSLTNSNSSSLSSSSSDPGFNPTQMKQLMELMNVMIGNTLSHSVQMPGASAASISSSSTSSMGSSVSSLPTQS